MNKDAVILKVCAVLLTAVFIFFTRPNPAAAGKRVMLAATEYSPYYGQQLPNQGVITEIIREAFKQNGYEAQIKFLPWKRALEMNRRGEVDALYTAWYREERNQWFAFSDPLPIANEIGFFKRIDRTISYRTIEDLRPFKIGIVRGYSNPPEFDRAGLVTEAVTEDRLNIKKLAVGRIDFVLIDKIIGLHIINIEVPESARILEWLHPPLKIEEQYLIFSKKAQDYEKKRMDFNRGLRQIIAEGTVKAIIAKHGFK